MNPTVAAAATQATSTIRWTPTAEPVDYASSTGQRNTATTVPAAATGVTVTGDTSAAGVKISARSATIGPATEVSGLESLRGITGTSVTIPTCVSAQYPLLDAVAGNRVTGIDNVARSNATSRDQTVRSRAFNLNRKYVANGWDNYID